MVPRAALALLLAGLLVASCSGSSSTEDPGGVSGAAGEAGQGGGSGQGGSSAGQGGSSAGQGGEGGSGAGEAGAGGSAQSGASGQAGGAGAAAGSAGAQGGQAGAAGQDLDKDGLDDGQEQAWAEQYLPYLSQAPGDGCPLGGIVFRLRPHPKDAAFVHILYDHLYERDCGLTSHPGDNEVFAATIDTSKPAPAGIVALRAINHQGTACQKQSNCGSCPGLDACQFAPKGGAQFPVVFASKDKHANYVDKTSCSPFLSCLDTCALAPAPAAVPLVNAGEPGAPLVTDLTKQGFIRAELGWKDATLYNFNPWEAGKKFGSAGVVADDLVDDAFETPVCP